MNSPGFTRPSLNCKLEECQKDFLLFQARSDVEEVEELPDPFPAKCTHCEREATYTKAEIGVLISLGSD